MSRGLRSSATHIKLMANWQQRSHGSRYIVQEHRLYFHTLDQTRSDIRSALLPVDQGNYWA